MRNIGKYHENQRLTCAPRSFTTKITKRHEEERSQMAPTTKTGVLFEHHVAKFEPLALYFSLQPFFRTLCKMSKNKRLSTSHIPHYHTWLGTQAQIFNYFRRRRSWPFSRAEGARRRRGFRRHVVLADKLAGGQKAQSWRWRFWMQQVDKQQLALV